MDRAEHRRSSHSVWETVAPGWDARHAYLEETARPVAERMLASLAPQPGETLLELAAGTGIVGLAAARAVEPGGKVIVSDFSQRMVDVARRRGDDLGLTNVEYRVLDAEQLALEDRSIDGILCRWGYMLMADPAAAVAESRRVLRAGGRVSCAVFDTAERNPWAAIPGRVLVERGALPAPEPGTPGIFALADAVRLASLFAGAGFESVAVEEVELAYAFDSLDDYWDFLTSVAGSIGTVVETFDDDARATVRAEIARRAAPFAVNGRYAFPAACFVALAHL